MYVAVLHVWLLFNESWLCSSHSCSWGQLWVRVVSARRFVQRFWQTRCERWDGEKGELVQGLHGLHGRSSARYERSIQEASMSSTNHISFEGPFYVTYFISLIEQNVKQHLHWNFVILQAAFSIALRDSFGVDILNISVKLDAGLRLLDRETFHIVASNSQEEITIQGQDVLRKVKKKSISYSFILMHVHVLSAAGLRW